MLIILNQQIKSCKQKTVKHIKPDNSTGLFKNQFRVKASHTKQIRDSDDTI